MSPSAKHERPAPDTPEGLRLRLRERIEAGKAYVNEAEQLLAWVSDDCPREVCLFMSETLMRRQ